MFELKAVRMDFPADENLDLYFPSDPTSIHCRNLATNLSMAIGVFFSFQKWGGPDRGSQLFWTCSRAKGRDAKKAEQLYSRRFPAYAKSIVSHEDEPLAAQLRSCSFFPFVPRTIKVLDESEFGDAVFVPVVMNKGRGSK